MDESDRKFAESVMNRLMKGSSVNGLRFFTPQLLLDGPKDIAQEAYINLSSEWDIFDSLPEKFPVECEDLTQEQEEIKLHQLRGEEVKEIKILSPHPHLVVHFESGKFLYMNGEGQVYEPWQAGLTSHGENSDTWLIVACPGGGMAVWCPEGRLE